MCPRWLFAAARLKSIVDGCMYARQFSNLSTHDEEELLLVGCVEII